MKTKRRIRKNLKITWKNFSTEENQCLYDKCKGDLEEIYDNTFRKEYASKAGVSGMKKVKNPLDFS